MFLSYGVQCFTQSVVKAFPQKAGYVLILVSQLSICFSQLFVKQIVGYQGFEIAWMRAIFLLLLNYPILQKEEPSRIYPKELQTSRVLLFRGVLASVQIAAWYQGICYLNLGDALVLGNTTPIWSVLLYMVYLRQKVEGVTIGLILLSFVGMLLIVRSSFSQPPAAGSKPTGEEASSHQLLGVLFCVYSAFSFAIIAYQN